MRAGDPNRSHLVLPCWRGLLLSIAALLSLGCTGAGEADDKSADASAEISPLTLAEKFVDAFYAWDAGALAALIVPGEDLDRVLYYQGWAQAANYQVLTRRPCSIAADESIQCAITVSDDFGQALGYTATDTFTLTVRAGRIHSAVFAGDDPPVFEAVFAWLAENRPEVLAGPCLDMFEGGTTPGDCARAVARAARDYAELN